MYFLALTGCAFLWREVLKRHKMYQLNVSSLYELTE